ncbi:TATA-binding protein-associated factor 172 [Episyrphus balteatus]|uniref:TATA-binding protein-associated factor 172 n=1 Tax=Episyrphus balteatus TaxID=286459 RepID=UPI0024851EFC|nr:TATA-binding protein-associated factor 172 [Episyrphus balteatus]XP_055849414.1 TATA-binding protein-associated factor 172 [Episyrphus balteatus]
MTSRLDRLFILLESGSSAVTRRAAAKQIGEVQKLYPHELHHLLNRLITYLHSNTWDTRIAAAQAVEAILKNVPDWTPTAIKKEQQQTNNENDEKKDIEANLLSFAEFNLSHILQKGARLIGSEGSEFDMHVEDDANKSAERLSRQRALLNEKLGITQATRLGVNLTDMITDEDVKEGSNDYNINEEKVPVEHILNINTNIGHAASTSSNGHTLSCREINRAKRKARQNVSVNPSTSSANLSRSNSSSNGSTITPDEPDKKKIKSDTIGRAATELFYSMNAPVPDATGAWVDAVSWPFENFCARLYLDLFNPKWEIRHGAATALRKLINSHSAGAGKSIDATQDEMDNGHILWLEDAALRLLCVLALDRFGDFVSDQVVAPVRETCAQVLGTIVRDMPTEKVHETVSVLLKLIKQNEWEVRHGGLLGLKYIFVVREDLLQIFLPLTISDILIGLFDSVDDVGAVAASTLIPVASWLPKLLNPAQVSTIVKMLWDLLLDQDELTSACNSFMGLLAAILCLPNSSTWIQMEPMSTLVPRLWPFLSHNTSSVRKSTLTTLKTLTQGTKGDEVHTQTPKSETDAKDEISFDSKNLKLNFGVIDWQPPLLQEALRHIYQRILVEPQWDIQELAKEVWMNLIDYANLTALLHAACPYVSPWICLAMQPARLPFDTNILIQAAHTQVSERRRIRDDLGGCSNLQQKLFLGGNEATPAEVREKNFIRARINAARVLGALSHFLVQPAPGVEYNAVTESPMECYTKVLHGHLQSRSAVQRTVCGLIIAFWAQSDSTVRPACPKLQEKLRYCVMEYVYYDEVALSLTRLLQEAHDFIATLKQYKIPINDFNNAKILTLEQIDALSTTMTENLKLKHNLKPKIGDMLEERRKCLQNSFQQTNTERNIFDISTQSALAGAIVCMRCLPEKLNPVVKPLMESIKREERELLQQLSAEFLVYLMDQISDRNPSPNNKIVTNLCTLLKSDTEFTPPVVTADLPLKLSPQLKGTDAKDHYYGILTLSIQQKIGGSQTNNTNATRGPGRPPTVVEVPVENGSSVVDSNEAKQCRIQRIGSTYTIEFICKYFGASLNVKVPIIWQIMFGKIDSFLQVNPTMDMLADKLIDPTSTNDLMTALQLIEIAAPHVDVSLHEELFQLLPKLGVLITHPLKSVRHMVARCIATIGNIDICKTMNFVVEHLMVLLKKIENVICRQGAIETIERLVEKLQIKMVPYVVLLVVPLLGCMSDPDEPVRLLSTHCFATLIQLMPLDSKLGKTEIASKELQARKTRDREFLDYLFAPKTIPDFKVPVPITVELRTYQQAGVNWLWFLNKYNLHGILCDDMGLGKTLQAICILAGDHHQRMIESATELPSLVICPPTLTGHWVYEVEKFLKSAFLRPLHYVGLPGGREKLRPKIGMCNLVVASYDTVRKDIDYFSTIHWNYCILDEGHIIKNGKTKSSKAIKQLKANHRLILSGTPIQNNVLELWSLFDFLMPGFLGTEKQFIARFSRPILSSRDSKSSPKEQEAGVLAMESLHRQILPFLLRRVKEDVLTDLPPKITQDLLCELSPLQERLYEDFSRSHLNSELKDCLANLGETENLNKKTHIFYALRYLQNVCNHPKLVLLPSHPEYTKITHELSQYNSCLNDIEHSAKLPALKQLLLDCGIGVETESVNQHRALIFCQLKAMLNIVENDLLKKHLPSVSYLRLDGSVPASCRQEIVNNFNTDPSIDVLLLTTQVGGLGLNLTGADTVIFVEHDWNPMKDLQAMDRAHRIGQKKVVNVYRLITRKSLEEKIMGLQKFKILTANTVVSAENASMDTMATEQLFDLFNLSDNKQKSGNGEGGSSNATSSSSGQMSVASVIENLPELWSENQYDEEYDITQFVQGLKK